MLKRNNADTGLQLVSTLKVLVKKRISARFIARAFKHFRFWRHVQVSQIVQCLLNTFDRSVGVTTCKACFLEVDQCRPRCLSLLDLEIAGGHSTLSCAAFVIKLHTRRTSLVNSAVVVYILIG